MAIPHLEEAPGLLAQQQHRLPPYQGRLEKISLWLHLSLEARCMLNGVVFYVLLFSIGQWARIVPTRWDAFRLAVSTVSRYAHLDWPIEDTRANYNALQLLSWFLLVFVAAPALVVTDLRMSPLWPASGRLSRVYPIGLARAANLPSIIFFVMFIIAHAALVLAIGALHNLNYMYAGRGDQSWPEFVHFGVSLVVIQATWIAARPVPLSRIAWLTGRVSAR